MRFIIIGGDAAGMSSASRAKRKMPDLEVTVFEKTQDVSYSACGMPYNIADPNVEIEDLVVRQADVFRKKQGIDLRTGHCVTAIDRATKKISGTDENGKGFSANYDKLLIGTGASPIIPPIQGIELAGVMALKSLNDGRMIKRFMAERRISQAVVIGMGYIALEMAEALHARGVHVAMVKPGKRFLPWMNETLSAVVREEIERYGVDIHAGSKIERIEKDKDVLSVVCENGDLKGQMILIGVGIKPNSELAEAAGLEMGPGNSIAVNKSLLTSDDDIYAAGDCADAYHVVTGQKTWIPLALRANRAGWAVADHLKGDDVALDGVAGTAVFKVFDMQVARTGLGMVEAEKFGFDPVEAVIKTRSRAHAHAHASDFYVQMVGDKKSGRLIGTQMVSREGAAHRVNAPAVALHNKMTVDAFAQCDLAYAPPFGPTWDPMLTAANQLLKKM